MKLVKLDDEYINFDNVTQIFDDGDGITIVFLQDGHRSRTGFDGEEAEALRQWLKENTDEPMEEDFGVS